MKCRFKPVEHVHYYATSAAEWKVSENPQTLITHFKKQGLTFSVYRVGLPLDARYAIKRYLPHVSDLIKIGTWVLK